MSDRDDILKLLERNKEAIKGFGVRRLGIFGSLVREELGPESDLDFIVEFDKKTFDTYMNLKFYLEDLFNRKVDLVLSDTIKPRLRPIIMKEAIYVPGL